MEARLPLSRRSRLPRVLLALALCACLTPPSTRAEEAPPEIGLTFVKGGCFEMGDQFGGGGADERPVHTVCVDDFYLGAYEVTESQWQAVMGRPPLHPFRSRGPQYPVTAVSWHDAGEFLSKLHGASGLDYRLPTEAEWEYAARGGGGRWRYPGTNDPHSLEEYACFEEACGGEPLPVKSKRPNPLGLYDMGGNAWEWVQDRYDGYYYRQSPRSNPLGDPFGVNRVLRGGSCSSTAEQLRTSYRDYVAPEVRRYDIGFRVALPAR